MNPLIQLKQTTSAFLIAFGLAYFGLVPLAQAVSPAPDGGYPGGNTAEGQNALFALTTGGFNTAVGYLSLRVNGTGNFNTAVGAGALLANTASENTAIGTTALFSNTSGHGNTASGFQALFSNTYGSDNTAIGVGALFGNTSGANNTAIGSDTLSNSAVGSGNTAIGEGALNFLTTGGGNTALGAFSGLGIQTANNVICIGAAGADVSGTCFIGNIRGVTPQNPDAIPMLIDSAGQLGTMNSSRRYKTDIQPMDKASESILALKPVRFRYKIHKNTTPQFGLIAEDVAEVNPNLVVYDADGKPYTVRYDAVNAMLLNEFLKEHKKIEEQQANIAELKSIVAQQRKDFQAATTQQQKGFESKIAHQQKQIERLTAGLQKVSAQIEASKPAPQVVNNP
ncbi:MAG: tail fiber domain-containing protein [Candidatus Udaeobacter sp.]